MKISISLLFLLLTSVPAAAQEKITYDDHIKEIFRSNCFKCHNPEKTKGDLDLTTYGALMQGGSSGPAVEGGNPDGSLLYTSMTHKEEPFMPPKSPPRPAAELELVRKWIAGGLLETSASVANITAKPKLNLALGDPATAKPEGPPPMPEHLILEPVTRTERTTVQPTIAASPWAPLVALAGQKQILFYNTDTLELLGVIPFDAGVAHDLTFSGNGKYLLAGGGVGARLGVTRLIDVQHGDLVLQAGEDFDMILCADVSSDQAYILSGGPDKLLKVYSTADGAVLHKIKKHTDWVTAARFSPDAVLMASGDRNGNLFVWETESGQLFYDLRGHQKALTSIAWRRDSNILCSGSEDGRILVWNMHDGKQVRAISAHGGGVLDIAFCGQ